MTPNRDLSGKLPDVLVNCDDLGMHPTINDAVVEILAGGIVKSASLMAVGNFFDDAVQKLAREGIREIGVHLTLGSEYPSLPVRPLSEAATAPSLVAGDGDFHPDIRAIRERLDMAEVRRELVLQIERVRAAGLRVSHLDGHMFFYELSEGGPEVYAIVRSLARSLGAPLRDPENPDPVSRFFLWDETPDIADRMRRYREWLTGGVCEGSEVIIHPAKDPSLLRQITRSADWRYADYLSFRGPALDSLVRGRVRVLSAREMAARRRQS